MISASTPPAPNSASEVNRYISPIRLWSVVVIQPNTPGRSVQIRSRRSAARRPAGVPITAIGAGPRKYAGVSRALDAVCLALRARHRFARGNRRAHTCHQHARARRAPAATTIAAASDPPYLRGPALLEALQIGGEVVDVGAAQPELRHPVAGLDVLRVAQPEPQRLRLVGQRERGDGAA